MDNLDIETFDTSQKNDFTDENINDIIRKYENHLSILKIKENVQIKIKFIFLDSKSITFENEINKLNLK